MNSKMAAILNLDIFIWTILRVRVERFCISLIILGLCASVHSVQDGCDRPTPCTAGSTLPDPEDCGRYYQCTPDGQSYERRNCTLSLPKYDQIAGRCRKARKANCSRPCPAVDFEPVPVVNAQIVPTLTEHAVSMTTPPAGSVLLNTTSERTTAQSIDNEQKTELSGPVVGTSYQGDDVTVNPSLLNGAGNANDWDNMTSSNYSGGEDVSESDEGQTTAQETTPLPTTAGVITTTDSIMTTTDSVTTTAEASTAQPTTESPPETTAPPPTTTAPSDTTTPKEPPGGHESNAPPYGAVTELASSTPANASVGGADKKKHDGGGMKVAMLGMIAGAAVAVLLLVAIAVVVVIIVRRKRSRRGHDIPRIENPEYIKASDPRDYRFSRDSTLRVEPTVNFQLLNNNGQMGDSSGVDSLKKKRRAPVPPSVQRNPHLLRKKGQAPAPPSLFTLAQEFDPEKRPITDIYEVDSHSSKEDLELSTFTVSNKNSVVNDNAKTDRKNDVISSDHDERSDDKDAVNTPLLEATENTDNNKDMYEDTVAADEPLLATSTFKPGDKNNAKDMSQSAEVLWDAYDKENNPFFDS